MDFPISLSPEPFSWPRISGCFPHCAQWQLSKLKINVEGEAKVCRSEGYKNTFLKGSYDNFGWNFLFEVPDSLCLECGYLLAAGAPADTSTLVHPST